MSYEKVKTIKIKDNKVYINCASNNVRPLSYTTEEYPYFSKILKEKGLRAVEIELLKSYEGGTLQEGINKFSKSLLVLRYVYAEEYKKFNWREDNSAHGTKEHKNFMDLRESKKFEDLLNKCLNYKIPKEKFIITKNHNEEKVYAKVCLSCIKWSRFKDKISKFDFEKQAEDNIYNDYKGIWKVEVLK